MAPPGREQLESVLARLETREQLLKPKVVVAAACCHATTDAAHCWLWLLQVLESIAACGRWRSLMATAAQMASEVGLTQDRMRPGATPVDLEGGPMWMAALQLQHAMGEHKLAQANLVIHQSRHATCFFFL